MPFANIKVEMALTAINNACRFPCAALFIFSPYTEHNICRKKLYITFKNILTNDLGRKKKYTYFIPIITRNIFSKRSLGEVQGSKARLLWIQENFQEKMKAAKRDNSQ